jgi:tRNA (guanine-N7-)-methyltransferase
MNQPNYYAHKNPYHERLTEFSDFVYRDTEGESFRGAWNDKAFKRIAPLMVEIGTGFGEFMRDYCLDHPHVNFVGMDYRFKRSFELAKKLAKSEIKNFRYLRANGERLTQIFAPNEVDELYYFFPDPWPKERHHKRRLFKENFLASAHEVLKPGGVLFVKTDHDGYAHWMEEVISKNKLFSLELKSFNLRTEYPEHFLSLYKTKFEKIFISQNIPIKAFVLRSLKENPCP